MYGTAQDAKDAHQTGGTGFVVSVESSVPSMRHFYVVTNSHVIREGFPVIRLNTNDGKTGSIMLDKSDWLTHEDGDDVAAAYIGLRFPQGFEGTAIRSTSLITQEQVQAYDVMPGDDICFVGRFVGLDGLERNLPTARFGHLSTMVQRVFNNKTGFEQESFLVEAHSYSGYSGSPVFLIGPTLFPASRSQRPQFVPILGIDWGHIAPRLPVMEKTDPRDKEEPLRDGWWVRADAGLMAVVPAWKVHGLLMCSRLAAQRTREENRLLRTGPDRISATE
jgi:hypothetical protein